MNEVTIATGAAVLFALAALLLLMLWRGQARRARELEERIGAAEQRAALAEHAREAGERELAAERERHAGSAEQLVRWREKAGELNAMREADNARAAERQHGLEARIADLQAVRAEVEEKFGALAAQALDANRDAFMQLANENFSKHKAQTAQDIEERRRKVDELVQPISRSLADQAKRLDSIESQRETAHGQITELMRSVGAEAQKLSRALRSSPGQRGHWGEESLRNVLEMAGLSAHCDFETQVHLNGNGDGGGGASRPDCVVRLPGGRRIVIDAKVSTDAFLQAAEAPDEAVRKQHLDRHAAQIRQHMRQLAGKNYPSAVSDGVGDAFDFVAMFVPGEQFYFAALQSNPGLFDEAVRSRVLIVTPTTLIALAKTIAMAWQQDDIARNAREVADLGKELYDRIAVMGEHIVSVGKELDSSVRAYNSFVGSLERRVMPQARRFRDLNVADGDLEELAPIQTTARELAASGDMALPGPEANGEAAASA